MKNSLLFHFLFYFALMTRGIKRFLTSKERAQTYLMLDAGKKVGGVAKGSWGIIHSAHQAWQRLCNVKNTPKVSRQTVTAYLKTIGEFKIPKLKTVLSAKNKTARINYCQAYKDFDFSNTLFTDECRVELNLNTVKVFAFHGEPLPTKPKCNPNYGLMIWAGISVQGVTPLVFVEDITDDTLDGDVYMDMLEEHRRPIKRLFGRKKWFYLQDNARPHVRPDVVEYIKKSFTKNIIPHPAQSPDLNPIELVWAKLKRLVQTYKPKNKAELRNAIEESWEKIGKRFVNNCIYGLNDRMKKILKNNGNIK